MATTEVQAAPETTTRAHLDYVRGPGADACPDAQAVRDAIATRVGYDPFSDGEGRVLLCRIHADALGLHAEITTRTADGVVVGTRSLRSGDRSCRALEPALLLVLSVAAGAPDAPAAAVAAAPSQRATLLVEEAVAAPAASRPVAAAAPAVRVGAAVFVTEASLPSVSAGGAISISVAGDRNALSLEVAGEVPRSFAFAGGQATVWRASAALVPCRSRGLLFGCALAAAGLLHGAGQGIPQAQSATGPWVGVGARLGARIPLSPVLALEARADLVVPVVRSRLLVGEAAVWTTPAVSGALGLALTRTFR